MTDQFGAPAPTTRFAVGKCLSMSLTIYGRNFIPFTVLGLLLSVPNLLLAYYTARNNESGFGIQAIAGILGVVVAALISASVVYGSFQDLRGAKASLGDAISRGLSSVFPVAIASILNGLAIGIAAAVPALVAAQILGTVGVFFAFPGLIVYLIFWVYVPAIVVEGEGIMASFSRSVALTEGRRWRILGLVLVVLIMSVVGGAVIGGLVGIIIGIIDLHVAFFGTLLAEYAAQSVFSVFGAVTVAVGYYLLRADKEGVDIDDIAKVFD